MSSFGIERCDYIFCLSRLIDLYTVARVKYKNFFLHGVVLGPAPPSSLLKLTKINHKESRTVNDGED